ncbi:hypothetical protein LQ327_15520 [Actinomycetospora endophytica]|uniref:Ig-like domain-containing protein n=1 Tax=Actinomycetospora endophytica TaxID=2291215 RepID=A0ABS8P962_9PSEU|nr:hypothetical protein [Actinomycetospora endophytica]MCD2194781.1 hypothetical protein [Actinomycetospora endophytica]
MDAADERSTQIGRRRREEPGTPAAEEPAAPAAAEPGTAVPATATRLGARRSGGSPDEAAAPTADTRLGARQHRAPTTTAGGSAPTSLGERPRTADDDTEAPATLGTALGARRRAAPGDDPVPVGAGTSLGARRQERDGDATAAPSSRPPQDDEVVRFGPGVPVRDPAAPSWSAGRGGAARARRRRRPWIGGLLTVGLLAAILAFLFLRQGDPMVVQSVHVDASLAPGTCDTVVDVVGTVATDGHGGTLRYQWQRSDGETTAVLSQTVPDKATTTQVHLQWSVSGRGRFPAQAILRVLEPTPMESAGGFTYSCS